MDDDDFGGLTHAEWESAMSGVHAMLGMDEP